MYEEEAIKLRRIFGEQLVAIHHIGSTSIPGLEAKPIIDIMPVVEDINSVDEHNESMREIGYEPKGENGIPERRYFQKGGDNRSHHVHIFQVGSPHVERHLAFRDYLRTHPIEAREYGDFKQKLRKNSRMISGHISRVRKAWSRILNNGLWNGMGRTTKVEETN